MPEVVAILLIAIAVTVGAWFASQGRYEFVVKIESGVPRATRGKVAANFLQTLAEACQRQPALTSAINVVGGKITHKAVAEAHSLPWSAPGF